MKKKTKIIIILVSALLLAVATFFSVKFYIDNKNKDVEEVEEEEEEEEEEIIVEKELQIIDVDSTSRPYAVVIDNIKAAFPQAGLQDAYLIYEIIVEGGQTRLLAFFKDKTTSLIGPVRSARHYFIDYVMENDAYFVHHGYSPQAIRDLAAYDIDNINGLVYDGSTFWRIKDKSAPHNSFTSMTKVSSRVTSLKYRTTTNKTVLLDYSIEEINLNENTGAIIANTVTIPYSNVHTTKYEYDSTLKVYKRSSYNVANVDKVTEEQYTAKNIIVINVKNYPDPYNSDAGRQTLDNVGSGTGYYITNGYAVPITYKKDTRSSQTVYKTSDGKEIVVNDGNTYIQIQPTTKKTTFK